LSVSTPPIVLQPHVRPVPGGYPSAAGINTPTFAAAFDAMVNREILARRRIDLSCHAPAVSSAAAVV
jgi:hypothetical protein